MSIPHRTDRSRLALLRTGRPAAPAVTRQQDLRNADRDALAELLPHVERAIRRLPADSRWRASFMVEARILRVAAALPLLRRAAGGKS